MTTPCTVRRMGAPDGAVAARCMTGAAASSARASAGDMPNCFSRLMSGACRRAGPCKSSSFEIFDRPVMNGWEHTIALADAAGGTPLFLQIARAVAEDARRGRLAPGAELPSSRRLAQALGVHRNTVLAAYDELA